MKFCLIVDDSRVVRKVARRVIEELGFECDEAEDGQKAYDFCQIRMPEVVLLDWNMPTMSGIEFLERLRLMANGKKTKVIFCTTENSAEHLQRAMKSGADEYVMKPFDGEILRSKFHQLGLLK